MRRDPTEWEKIFAKQNKSVTKNNILYNSIYITSLEQTNLQRKKVGCDCLGLGNWWEGIPANMISFLEVNQKF